jgi:hypothetical protein
MAETLRILVLGVLLVILPLPMTLAHASPPDPTWIDGIYDDGDLDGVVALVTSSAATIELSLSDHALRLSLVLPPLHWPEECLHACGAHLSIHARPPPVFGA